MLRVKESVVVVQGPGNWKVVVVKKNHYSIAALKAASIRDLRTITSFRTGSLLQRNGLYQAFWHSRSEPLFTFP
jgi:hypothetical protein